MTEKITIRISPEGMKFDAEGFKGGKCLVEQDEIEKYLNTLGVQQSGKTQKKKLEQMYSTAPGQTTTSKH